MNKKTWKVDQPVWICYIVANGATASHAGVITEIDDFAVKAKMIRQPFRHESFDHRGEVRNFKHSRLADRWLVERLE